MSSLKNNVAFPKKALNKSHVDYHTLPTKNGIAAFIKFKSGSKDRPNPSSTSMLTTTLDMAGSISTWYLRHKSNTRPKSAPTRTAPSVNPGCNIRRLERIRRKIRTIYWSNALSKKWCLPCFRRSWNSETIVATPVAKACLPPGIDVQRSYRARSTINRPAV